MIVNIVFSSLFHMIFYDFGHYFLPHSLYFFSKNAYNSVHSVNIYCISP